MTLGRGALLVALASGCGDPIVPDSYRGETLAAIEGDLSDRPDDETFFTLGKLRVSLFWSSSGLEIDDLSKLVEQPANGVSVPVPSKFVINVFEPAPEELYVSGQRYAIGRLVSYFDENDNGRKDGEDRVWGLDSFGFIYAPEALSGDRSPSKYPISAGLHRSQMPLLCAGTMPERSEDETCGVPLGIACSNDGECGGGSCLRRAWPGGACVISEPPPNGCRPKNAAFYPLTAESARGYYLRACVTSSDCLRDGAESFRCDPAIGGCVPNLLSRIEVREDLPSPSFCSASSVIGNEPTLKACQSTSECGGEGCTEGAERCECRMIATGSLACVPMCNATSICPMGFRCEMMNGTCVPENRDGGGEGMGGR
jgi:hypothetical protein